MFRKHRTAIAANILLPAGIALALVGVWFWATGDFNPSAPTVVGLALGAAGLATVVEWAARHTVHAFRRRSRPSRHRKHAASRPLAERANGLSTELATTEGEA